MANVDDDTRGLERRPRVISAPAPQQKASRSDIFLFYFYFFPLLPPNRKRDQPEVVHPEGPAAFVRRRLLPIHRLADDAALQQSGGVDRLLQAGLCVPLTGASSSPVPHTHTHAQTAIFSTHSRIPFARSQWITCCPTVQTRRQFLPSSFSFHLACPHIKRHIHADALWIISQEEKESQLVIFEWPCKISLVHRSLGLRETVTGGAFG